MRLHLNSVWKMEKVVLVNKEGIMDRLGFYLDNLELWKQKHPEYNVFITVSKDGEMYKLFINATKENKGNTETTSD